MSLSILFRLIGWSIAVLVSAWMGTQFAGPLAEHLSQGTTATIRDAQLSKRSLVYRGVEYGPVSFVFSQPVTQAKLLVYPVVAEADRGREEGFVYGLRLSWQDAAGDILSSHEVVLQADAPDIVYASGNTFRFFRTGPDLVAEQDVLLVESAVPAARLTVVPIIEDEAIFGVDMRAFEKRTDLAAQSAITFNRLSETTQRQLIAPNAFPANMLTELEKSRFVRNHPRAVGPLGVEGRDFEVRVLYEAQREGAER